MEQSNGIVDVYATKHALKRNKKAECAAWEPPRLQYWRNMFWLNDPNPTSPHLQTADEGELLKMEISDDNPL